MNYKVIWVFLVLLVKGFSSLKILAVFPHEGKSHLWIFIPIIRQLSARGHDLTVITHHTMGVTSKNFREIIVKGEFEGVLDYNLEMFNMPSVALSSGSALVLTLKGIEGCHSMFSNPEVQQLFASDQKFDLIIAEMFNSECWLSFVDKFGAPFIGLSSTTLMPWHSGSLGQPDNPAYIPNNHLYSGREGLLLRTENFLLSLWFKTVYYFRVKYNQYLSEKYLSRKMKSFDDMMKNVSLLLMNSHFSSYHPMPLVPGIVEIGGIHIGVPKKLPEIVISRIEKNKTLRATLSPPLHQYVEV